MHGWGSSRSRQTRRSSEPVAPPPTLPPRSWLHEHGQQLHRAHHHVGGHLELRLHRRPPAPGITGGLMGRCGSTTSSSIVSHPRHRTTRRRGSLPTTPTCSIPDPEGHRVGSGRGVCGFHDFCRWLLAGYDYRRGWRSEATPTRRIDILLGHHPAGAWMGRAVVHELRLLRPWGLDRAHHPPPG